MSREFGLEVIDKSRYGVISMIDEYNEPYGIPSFYCKRWECLVLSFSDGWKKKSKGI